MRRTEVLQGIRLMKFEEILDRTRLRELSQGEAASVLGGSERTFRRQRRLLGPETAASVIARRCSRRNVLTASRACHRSALSMVIERLGDAVVWSEHPGGAGRG